MKKLGIDARLLTQSGVGVYIRNLLYNLSRSAPADTHIYVYIRTQDKGRIELDPNLFTIREANHQWHTIGEQTGFLSQLNQDKLDLMHFTYFSYPVFYKRSFVSTIHDLTPLLFRTGRASTKNPFTYELKYIGMKLVLRSQMKYARAIITPTQSIKRQLAEYYGSSYESKIVVTPEGVNEEYAGRKENGALKKRFPSKFLLYVGNFYPHKNVERLVDAYAKIQNRIPLVLVGSDGFFAKRLKDKITTLGLQDNIQFYANPSTEDLVFFYKHATALVHPSLAEGFGLTLIEAAHFGCPIIASDIEVVREMLGSQFVPFNPKDTSNIAEKIEGFLAHEQDFSYESVLKKYSFKTMTKMTVEIYEKYLV